MYTSTITTTLIALLSASSALSVPRPAAGNGTHVGPQPAAPGTAHRGAHGKPHGSAHAHFRRGTAGNSTHIVPRPGAPQPPHAAPHGAPHGGPQRQHQVRGHPTGTSAVGPASTSAAPGGGKTYKASFTEYGAGDQNGSPNCNTASAACGFYNQPGFNAALSEAAFGAGDGKGPGPACGTCWQLSPETDPSGKPLTGAKEIVVKVNNLCPADSNPLCSQKTTQDKNQYGASVNFDLCMDDGAGATLFGTSGQKLAVGSATQVPCTMWKGSADLRQH